MSLLRRVMKHSENLLLTKNWIVSPLNGSLEVACFSKKVQSLLPPKKPLSAYLLFIKENRKEVLKENPALSNTEQIKKLAEKWNQLTNESKKPFEVLAREGVVQYGEEHKKFFENLSEEEKLELYRQKSEKKENRRILKLKKALRESLIPKPSASAYTLFVQSQAKDKSTTKQPVDFIKEVAEKWQSLSEKVKKSFEEQAEADKSRYLVEMEEWKKKLVKEGKENLLKEYEEFKHKRKSLTETFDETELKVKKASKTIKNSKTSISKQCLE